MMLSERNPKITSPIVRGSDQEQPIPWESVFPTSSGSFLSRFLPLFANLNARSLHVYCASSVYFGRRIFIRTLLSVLNLMAVKHFKINSVCLRSNISQNNHSLSFFSLVIITRKTNFYFTKMHVNNQKVMYDFIYSRCCDKKSCGNRNETPSDPVIIDR